MLRLHLPKSYFINPPHPSGYQKIQGIFRYQILLRGSSVKALLSVIKKVLPSLSSKVRKNIDVDPLSTYF